MASFLKERSTKLKTAEYTTPLQNIEVGIPQGSPLSPILFLFYNAYILEECNKIQRGQVKICATGFINDIAILACGPTTEANCLLRFCSG